VSGQDPIPPAVSSNVPAGQYGLQDSAGFDWNAPQVEPFLPHTPHATQHSQVPHYLTDHQQLSYSDYSVPQAQVQADNSSMLTYSRRNPVESKKVVSQKKLCASYFAEPLLIRCTTNVWIQSAPTLNVHSYSIVRYVNRSANNQA